MQRILGIAFGVATHVLFLFTVWHLFWFLKGYHAPSTFGSLWIDVGLALQYAVAHSVLLLPSVRARLVRVIDPAFYGCLFCVATCLGLLFTIACWRSHSTELWRFDGWTGGVITAAFFGAWIALIYSMSLTGLGHQTGWTSWWHWVKRRPLPPRRFVPRGAYRWLRHPIYCSFMGLLWFTPVMTIDRLLLAGLWTVYIFIGSYLKDERLAFYSGESYRRYQSQVAGYPFFPFGPLGKRALVLTIAPDEQEQRQPPQEQAEKLAA